FRHVQGQRDARDCRACRNVSGYVEREYTAAEFAHGGLAREEVVAEGIAEVTIRRNVLVERVVLTGVDIDSFRDSEPGSDAAKCGREHKCGTRPRNVYSRVFIRIQEPLSPLRLINCASLE